ncbi:hypothetical protein CYJ73_24370 [Gordonia terrae]|uniref:Uncharacterized protein n=1 Tax=Gordonia terrae TaxID=2055 RepID=A0A2I1R1H4_9ACTN|nr:hypothetical protein CYJ73_24370 [Gordonia terrae]
MWEVQLCEALQRPKLDFVGALVFSPEKNSRDVAELVDLPAVGVQATIHKKAIFALAADVVLHSPQPYLDETGRIDDVVRLLRSGKNVVSVMSFLPPRKRGWDIEASKPASKVAPPRTAPESIRASCSSVTLRPHGTRRGRQTRHARRTRGL